MFHEVGELRLGKLVHHLVGASLSDPMPTVYHVGDKIEVTLRIQQHEGQEKWVPFVASDVQLELKMLVPHARTTMVHNGDGLFSGKLQVPDISGLYKLVLDYHRPGLTHLHLEQEIRVRPLAHNETERFILAAYPYYVSTFSMMAGLLLFGIAFLYHKD